MTYTSKGNIIACLIVAIILIGVAMIMKANSDYELSTFDELTKGTVAYCNSYYSQDSDGNDILKYEITVNYTVGGVTYSCKESGFGRSKDTGAEIMVYFASNNPGTAILHEPEGLSFGFWVLMIVGGGIGLGAVVAIILNIYVAIRNLSMRKRCKIK